MKEDTGQADKFYLEKRTRSFVYLSTAKLDPLYRQIKEPIRKRIAVSLGIAGLPGPITPKIEAKYRPPTTNEMDVLAVVLSNLDRAGEVGTIDDTRSFFAGRLRLRWAMADEFLFLTGSTAQTLIVLTGSNRHMVGHFESEPDELRYPGSSRVGVFRALGRIFAESEEEGESDMDFLARLAVRLRRGPQETFEFVARRLAEEDVYVTAHDHRPAPDFKHLQERRIRMIHGTPLYLAYPD